MENEHIVVPLLTATRAAKIVLKIKEMIDLGDFQPNDSSDWMG